MMVSLVGVTYVRGLDEVLILQGRNTGLSALLVHLFQLRGTVLLHVALDNLDNLLVVGQIRTVSLQADHVQRRVGLQGTVDVEELVGVLGLVQVRRHPTIAIGLGRK